jgi:hypothetical protein
MLVMPRPRFRAGACHMGVRVQVFTPEHFGVPWLRAKPSRFGVPWLRAKPSRPRFHSSFADDSSSLPHARKSGL